jgi:plastocyanin
MVAVVVAGGITAAIAQGDDPPSAASFKTVDGADQFQLVSGSGSATSANIVTGGTVTFANASVEMHNVDFNAQGQGGVTCQQTAGGSSPSALQFPGLPTAGAWGGVCTFTRAGTYSFMCDEHEGMTGTVVVTDVGAAPHVTTTPVVTATTPVQTIPAGGTTTAPTPVSSTTPAPSTAQAPVTIARKLSFKISLAQRGSQVRGVISGARSSERAKVALTARRGDVGLKGKVSTPVGVGSLSALTTKVGALAFAVKLDGTALAALAKRHRLALTVRVTAPTVNGTAHPRVFKIVVRP